MYVCDGCGSVLVVPSPKSQCHAVGVGTDDTSVNCTVSGGGPLRTSAVKSADDVAHYRAAGADVVLVGEALVTSDPVATLEEFLGV